MKILLNLAYLGTRYAGFQVQPAAPTVQASLQDAIEATYGERYPVKGCSRTDAGVHALSFYATFDTDVTIPADRIPLALNTRLPDDISILSARIVPDSFHVRHDVLWKEYEYRIHNSPIRDPFTLGREYRLPRLLTDEGAARMKEAASAFVGTHDFSGFMSAGSSVADTVRTIRHLHVLREGERVIIRVAADGFLYNMVRIIAGTLIEAGQGRIEPSSMAEIIASCDRSKAGYTAPACGLYLRQVKFKNFD
ncbi:MAG: tRNA pseudouridine(38-40) synthase TruA [Clostridia bacterium]|nr:tRNA pseudouridine(38-40) synthase TruA [Clostridia bacterium]